MFWILILVEEIDISRFPVPGYCYGLNYVPHTPSKSYVEFLTSNINEDMNLFGDGVFIKLK